jgi:regulator of sirC expression with transglutaminase-like and TPR domain
VSDRAQILSRLKSVGRLSDEAIDLAKAALLLAALDLPDADLGRYMDYLTSLDRDIGDEGAHAQNLLDRRHALRAVLAERHDYRGDSQTYDDLDNANLMRVIDRRKGLPVALGILYIHAARSVGWTAEGLNVPAHFLIRLRNGDEQMTLDPFNGGRSVDMAEVGRLIGLPGGVGASPGDFGAMSNREILLRLQNNIKARALQKNDLERAVAVLDSMIALSPSSAGLWWEAATHLSTLGRPKAATEKLEACLSHPDMADPPDAVKELLSGLKRSLN